MGPSTHRRTNTSKRASMHVPPRQLRTQNSLQMQQSAKRQIRPKKAHTPRIHYLSRTLCFRLYPHCVSRAVAPLHRCAIARRARPSAPHVTTLALALACVAHVSIDSHLSNPPLPPVVSWPRRVSVCIPSCPVTHRNRTSPIIYPKSPNLPSDFPSTYLQLHYFLICVLCYCTIDQIFKIGFFLKNI